VKWENQVINGMFPLRRSLSYSDHSAVFLTEYPAQNLPNALLKLVPAIPTLREAQLSHWTTAATLSHPHLTRVLESGRCQLGGLQFLFVVMEYAEQTLSQILAQRALAPEELRKMLRPTLDALAFLHRKQLVQGQLKPSNILVVNGQLKLASDSVRPGTESTASIAQSSVYDPPESRDGSFSAAGDVWSLGVAMVEALTQSKPSWPNRQSETAVLPTTIPQTFVRIVQQCLNRNPAKRPTVADLEAQINPAPEESADRPELSRVQTMSASLLHAASEEPEPAIPVLMPPMAEPPVLSPPRRRLFIPAVAGVVIVSIVLWAGQRLFSSQFDSQPEGFSSAAFSGATSHGAVSRGAASPEGALVEAGSLAVASAAVALPADPSPAEGSPVSAGTTLAESDAAAISPPKSVLHQEVPDVPPDAIRTVRGRIIFPVRVTVDRSGDVVHVTVLNHRSSRYFARLATEAAGKWKFAPSDQQDSRKWLLRFEFTRDGATAHANIPGG
jgi:serine/threonine protein kinase